MTALRSLFPLSVLALLSPAARSQTTADAAMSGLPFAVVDLGTDAGAALIEGRWRYHDAQLVSVAHHAPGPDLRASGPAITATDITPHAGAADFDTSSWPVIAPADIATRRGAGRVSFGWYRIEVTIPERLGAVDPTGTTAVFEVVVDDYAEVWVDGVLPRALGQTGGALVKGFNAPNRVVLARDARPGQRFRIAVFAMNGPVSDPPSNFLWLRSATIDFYRASDAYAPPRFTPEVTRVDPALEAVLPEDAMLERIATGFRFTEGPVWVPRRGTETGFLLFSDPNTNTVYRWTPDGQVSVFRTKSGYSDIDIGAYHQPGSNGIALDAEGRVTLCEHGRRRVARIERTGAVTVLADRYRKKRLSSPNDLVYRRDGALFFTDPPFGLPAVYDDPKRELDFCGVFALVDGELRVVADDLRGPNGIAFSPDERFLYVGDWDVQHKAVMRYEVRADGTAARGETFFDMTAAEGEDAIDGIKVDARGNVWVSGPGGVWILSADGKHLGTLRAPEHPHNLAFGDDDGRTLFLCAQTSVYRVRVGVAGAAVAQ